MEGEENSTGYAPPWADCSNMVHPDNFLSSVNVKVAIYTMYSVIFVVAMLGNGFVCFIVLSSPRMKTVTNYFIMNLAVGDILITLLCVPFTSVALMRQYWPFGELLCPVVSYSQALSVFVSAYTLVAISIDKFIVIMWPLRPRISKKFATSVIGMVWLVAGATVLPVGTFTVLNQPPNSTYEYCDKYICSEVYSEVGEYYGKIYSHILMVLQYYVPLAVLLFTYTSIAVVIWCHRIPGEAENCRDRRIARSKRKMVKMMVTIVFVYTLCWLPYNILLVAGDKIEERLFGYLYFPFHGLAMSHACYNPIIYCYMNSRFREGLSQITRCIPCLRKCLQPLAMSSGLPHTGTEGTDTSLLQRSNTCTTYVSMKRQNVSVYNNQQPPVRSASLRTPNGTKRIRYTEHQM